MNTPKVILSAEQIRTWDLYTMEKESISSLELMEKAALACFEWIVTNGYGQSSFSVFCGKGNNGGDGLALARLLSVSGCKVNVYILEPGHKGTDDFQANLALLHNMPVHISFIQEENHLHPVQHEDIIIDALFGSGLNRSLDGMAGKLVRHINKSGNKVLAIDIPSGMFTDSSSSGDDIIRATYTLSFQAFKLAFLVSENAACTGIIHLLDIGLTAAYLDTIQVRYKMADLAILKKIHKQRNNFSHKGTYGHAALIAGSEHMMGAAVLAAKACLRSGTGKLTCYVPGHGNNIMQIAVPEAMTATLISDNSIKTGNYDAIGIGPGLGIYDTNAAILSSVFSHKKPVVIDADALNTLAEEGKELLKEIPALSVLTPHPKEFEHLFGKTANDFDRISLALRKARELNVVIVLKGYNTLIAMPDGKAFFNTTGNPGMATAGSGDVLTGIITGLLAQKYSPQEAALLGVFIHGCAGDIAAKKMSQEAMIASDIIRFLGEAFLMML